MEYEILPEEKKGFVRVQVHGLLTPDDAAKLQGEIVRTYPQLNRFWDFSDSDLTAWSRTAMKVFIGLVAEREPRPGKARAAILVSRDVDYGISRMFGAFVPPDNDVEYGLFREEKKAAEWVTQKNT